MLQIAEKLNGRDLIRFGAIEANMAEPHLLLGDAGRLINEVGFKAKFDLDSGLAKTISWWKENLAGLKRAE